MDCLKSGFLIIDKPEGLTSHDVVVHVRRLVEIRRVGHMGTLDPMATGVLPIAFGKATRLIRFLNEGMKVYQGTVQLGFSTDTFDREGEPTSIPIEPCFNAAQLEEISQGMLGEHWQVPPPFSAKKIQGVRAYRLARQGKAPVLEAQKVSITRLAIEVLSANQINLEIQCSAGTYVRSVAHEIGSRLGCGAHLASLRRVASGEFSIEQAVRLESLQSGGLEALKKWVIPMGEVLKGLPELQLGSEATEAFVHGRDFVAERSLLRNLEKPLVRVLSESRELLGLAELKPGQSVDETKREKELYLQPKVVLVDRL